MIPTGEPADLAPPEADREENALRMKKNLILLFLLLAGVMFGSLLAAATRGKMCIRDSFLSPWIGAAVKRIPIAGKTGFVPII